MCARAASGVPMGVPLPERGWSGAESYTRTWYHWPLQRPITADDPSPCLYGISYQ